MERIDLKLQSLLVLGLLELENHLLRGRGAYWVGLDRIQSLRVHRVVVQHEVGQRASKTVVVLMHLVAEAELLSEDSHHGVRRIVGMDADKFEAVDGYLDGHWHRRVSVAALAFESLVEIEEVRNHLLASFLAQSQGSTFHERRIALGRLFFVPFTEEFDFLAAGDSDEQLGGRVLHKAEEPDHAVEAGWLPVDMHPRDGNIYVDFDALVMSALHVDERYDSFHQVLLLR
mmetsp:Transcript_21720/g.33466  ORF Transcript_21720/g.33466 Transcript_21720/m.33466 type:complete len:230 (-) Transcript_21720:3938-4627(-)